MYLYLSLYFSFFACLFFGILFFISRYIIMIMTHIWIKKKCLILFIDFPDIQTDQRRIEHIEALTGVLKDILDPNLLPKPEELVAIYGRVNAKKTTKNNHFGTNSLTWVFSMHSRWWWMRLAFWIKIWIRSALAYIWVYLLPITVANQMQ